MTRASGQIRVSKAMAMSAFVVRGSRECDSSSMADLCWPVDWERSLRTFIAWSISCLFFSDTPMAAANKSRTRVIVAKNARLGAVVTINPHDLSLCLTACRYKAYSPTVACFLSSEQLQFVADMRVRRSLVSEIPSAKVQVAHPSLYQRTKLVAGGAENVCRNLFGHETPRKYFILALFLMSSTPTSTLPTRRAGDDSFDALVVSVGEGIGTGRKSVERLDGARERTRTSTTLRSLAPEASASASSATRARVLWVKPRLRPGLQFQRGFFIVPAACRFVNEGAGILRPNSKTHGEKVQDARGKEDPANLNEQRVCAHSPSGLPAHKQTAQMGSHASVWLMASS
jgi:hypothetical protein